MAVKLNRNGFDRAKQLITSGKVVIDDRETWSAHQPSTEQENQFTHDHGYEEYSRWHLGVDTDEPENSKARYKFPYGDFENVHRCAVISAESRAGQYKYSEVENAAAHLHGMIDALKPAKR